MIKAEPISPRLDGKWSRPFDSHRKRRSSNSGSQSPPPRARQQKYFANKSVRRPSDASETSTLVGSAAGGPNSSSLLDRMGTAYADDDTPSLLLRLTDRTPTYDRASHSRKNSITKPPSQMDTLSAAQDFADRLIQEALQNGAGTINSLNGERASKGDRANSPVRFACNVMSVLYC